MRFLVTRRRLTGMAVATLALSAERSHADVVQLNVHLRQMTGDLDTLLKLGAIRILVPYSRSLFFEDKGRFQGLIAYVAEDLEKYVRQIYPEVRQRFEIVLIPTSRDRLLPDLLAGEGAMAAGDITITPERAKLVSFTTPTITNVTELVVTKTGVVPMASAPCANAPPSPTEQVRPL